MKVPDEAVEAVARRNYEAEWGDGWEGVIANVKRGWLSEARAQCEAAAPIMLSHELEQTRLAHLDAVVNAQGLADAWEAGMRHALAWLGLRHYGDVMAKDNPHKGAEG